jgi:hypothetical protein
MKISEIQIFAASKMNCLSLEEDMGKQELSKKARKDRVR